MKPRINTAVQVFAALLILASAQASAADSFVSGIPAVTTVAWVTPARDKYGAHVPKRPDGRGVAPVTGFDPDPLFLTEEWLDESARDSENAVRLYPIGRDAGTGEGAGAAATSAAPKQVTHGAVESSKAARPGSWALLLAGLFGVGAIARRRMSA